jgi:S-DNA-T family DNA segregation ATPase FtsK/SpoIIIE
MANDTALLKGAFADGEFNKLFSSPIHNKGGIVGMILAYLLLSTFGYLAFILPAAVLYMGIAIFGLREMSGILRTLGLSAAAFFLIGVLFSLAGAQSPFLSGHPGLGGAIGHYSARLLKGLTGSVGSYTIVISLLVIGLSLFLPSLFGTIVRGLFAALVALKDSIMNIGGSKQRKRKREIKRVEKQSFFRRILQFKKREKIIELPDTEIPELKPDEPAGQIQKKSKKEATAQNMPFATDGYKFPDIDLLMDAPAGEPGVSKGELQATAEVLKATLATFGIELANGEVEIYPGPIITRFEFKPAPGIKISQIVNLADDLALAMKAKRVRIVAPIPGKSAVGVEIPNRYGQTVYLKEIITSGEFQNSKFILPLALGKTISGGPFVVDLAGMPHLLIAGATGSGKSVCLNSIITSLLYRLSPESVRFILIDPKMLELTAYNDLPHLEKPVVTEIKYAEKSLGEAVIEMEDRYRRLAKVSVRNIADYNKTSSEPLPYVVIIVDELADLMMSGSNRIEMLITRLAQMARAVGIHLILATQRPSVDVITGLIKANFSTRIAFQVATKVDSRTILDMNGAEKLLGKGDLLFMNPSFPEPMRAHGAYITGEETQKICKFLGQQEYQPKRIVTFKEDSEGGQQYDPIGDALYKEAAELVIRHKQGSVSLLQRRLGIGYQRAARLIDQLEQAGVVGPYDGSKAREVLVDEQYIIERLEKSRE